MIDEISFKILKILQEKARIPNVEVARQVGMAPSAVLERIRKLESQGLIDGYEVRLNPKRFGKSLVAFVSVKTAVKAENDRVAKALADIPEVQEVHYVTGGDGYLVKIRASDTTELNHIIREKIGAIEGVSDTLTSVALSTYKETARIPLGEKPFQE
jgi:Lrp/AsnC family transcriptional regulator, leucine-responsive regulatory protein